MLLHALSCCFDGIFILSCLHAYLLAARQGGWDSRYVRLKSVEFSLYQPSLNSFASIRVTTSFTITGDVKTSISAFTFPLFTSRYQPSVPFEIVMALLFVAEVKRVCVCVLASSRACACELIAAAL